MKIPFLTIKQPIGTFYMTSIKAKNLMDIVKVIPRSASNEGIQRDLSSVRVNEIANFSKEADATFPTAVIVSIAQDSKIKIDEEKHEFEIEDGEYIGNVIDGQHRLAGLMKSGKADDFELPVVFMFDLTLEEEAYVFSIINSKQTPVTQSLIYDLFGLSTVRSPQRTVHEIARSLNMREDSPFHLRLRMLGKKTDNQEYATLSQGTFVTSILSLICVDSEIKQRPMLEGLNLEPINSMPFRKFYIMKRDDIILKVILNCFTALKEVYPDYWKAPNDNILWKSTGFGGVVKSLNALVNIGIERKTLTVDFFKYCFENMKRLLNEDKVNLTSKDFPGGGEQQQRKLAKYILDANKG